jgi:hypothetical protein
MEVSINSILPIVLFIIGWVFAVIDTGWRSPILWVTSAIAAALFLS